MKNVIEEERQALKKELKPLWESELEGLRIIAAGLENSINESFQKIQAETDFLIARLQGDAGRLEMAAPKLPVTGTLMVSFARALRNFARRVAGEPEAGSEKSEVSNLIVLPRNGLEPMDDG